MISRFSINGSGLFRLAIDFYFWAKIKDFGKEGVLGRSIYR
jgi:hypothetical protein